MITTATDQLEQFEKNISGTSFLARKMKCEYLSNKEVDLNNFYNLGECGVMLMGENMSVCGRPTEEEWETVLFFCQFMGVYGLETEVDNLELNTKRTMHLMEFRGEGCEMAAEAVQNENIYGFSEFCCNNFPGTAFSTVYAYLARKVNKSISDIYYFTEDRKIISGAVATRYGGDEIYITFVSTARSHRNKGLSSRLIRHIVAANPGRRVILMCEDELVPFYEKLGFVNYDNVYLYTLREENI